MRIDSPPLHSTSQPVFLGSTRKDHARLTPLHPDRFTGASSNTHPQKVKQTIADANALFRNVHTKAELLQALQKTFDETLVIYDATQPGLAWVDELCQGNTLAFFKAPDSVLYPHTAPSQPQTESTQKRAKKPDPSYPAPYLNEVLPSLERDKKVALFLSSAAQGELALTTLKHEAFHALQWKNGLPFGLDRQSDDKAFEFRDEFHTPILAHGLKSVGLPIGPEHPFIKGINQIGQMYRILYAWTYEIPMTLLKYAAKSLWKRSKNPTDSSPGKALRLNMAREQELDWYFILNGRTWRDRTAHLIHWLTESKLQALRSYALD